LFLSIIENCVADFSSPSGLPVRLLFERIAQTDNALIRTATT
jgi:hypothetical protein